MTTTHVPVSGIVTECSRAWCLATYNCTGNKAGSSRLHEGRRSSFSGAFRGRGIDVYPIEFDAPYIVQPRPLVALDISTNGQGAIELEPAVAVRLAEAVASYAAEQVEVGDSVTFEGSDEYGDPTGISISVTRLSDVVFEYGSGAPRYSSFGAVEIAISGKGIGKPDVIGVDSAIAAQLSRSVAAVAREVTR